ncbi:DUF3993 domain-containing protein [Neobacillus notoginsengisoli]|uniref:DUF3993 domain-containing protein n=1 Tax=Neobacillus notoginsengisoli TaxID=1578198 RepID=A0A417YER7_9BACI|nr:DUF3993 domain-containing protein [Neobacillus notoginsengisoli]RHW31142.1 DUF3993 domain-containing protein [Neobacillus notoginsengisoli]
MKKALVFICALILFMPVYSKAETGRTDRDEILTSLKKGYEAQMSLSEQLRTKKEIDEVLSPYFTDDYKALFWDANVIEENGKYVTYGSDFAQFYIPYYEFSNSTEVVIDQDKAYVFEFFPANTEGPVGYEDHYEGLLLEKEKGTWKVSEYLYNQIPESILHKSAKMKSETISVNIPPAAKTEISGEAEAASIQFQIGMNPIATVFQYAAFLGSNHSYGFGDLFNN